MFNLIYVGNILIMARNEIEWLMAAIKLSCFPESYSIQVNWSKKKKKKR